MADFIVPLVTPLTDDARAVSEVRLARLVRKCVEEGATKLYLLGDIGEFNALSTSERKLVVEISVRESQGRIPIYVNVTSFSTSKSLDLAQHAARHGARSAVISSPFYGPYTQEERLNHLRMIAGYGNLKATLIDPCNNLSDEEKEELMNLPSLTFADSTSFDEWWTEDSECSVAHLVSLFAPPDAELKASLVPLVFEYGSAPVAKCLLEKFGFEAGSLRSPKLPVSHATLNQLFDHAA